MTTQITTPIRATKVITKPILALCDSDKGGLAIGLASGINTVLDTDWATESDSGSDCCSDSKSGSKQGGVLDTAGEWDKVVASFILTFFIAYSDRHGHHYLQG